MFMGRRRFSSGWNGVLGTLALVLAFVGSVYPMAAGERLAVQATTRSVWDGVFTTDQVKRGQASYQQECVQCHYDDLLGDGMAPALVGRAFHFRWSDLSVGDMLAAIRTTMPLGAPASLSEQAYVDIISYLLQVNKFPTGDTELPTDLPALESIIIEEKPAEP